MSRFQSFCAVLALGSVSLSGANAAIIIDSVGDMGVITGTPGGAALLYGVDDVVHGVGNSKVFLTVNQTGSNDTERGYNTEGVVEFDTDHSGTTELPLSEVPLVAIDDILYREFAFVLNQTGGSPSIAINEIQLFLGPVNDLVGYDLVNRTLPGANKIFDWQADADQGDTLTVTDSTPGVDDVEMLMFIPEAAFQSASGSFVYFQTSMGTSALPANDGKDKWLASTEGFCVDVPGIVCDPQPMPAPGTLVLLGIGAVGLRLGRRLTLPSRG